VIGDAFSNANDTNACVTEDENHVTAHSAQTDSHSCQSSGKRAVNDELVQVDEPTANGIPAQTLTADPFNSTHEIHQMKSELTYPSESFLNNDASQQRQHSPAAQNDENTYSPNINNSGNAQSVVPNLSQMEISEKECDETKKFISTKPLADAKDVDALKPSLPRSRSFDKNIFDKRLAIGFRPSRKNLTLELLDDKQSIASSLSVKSFPPMQSRKPTGVEKLPLLPRLQQPRDSQNQVTAKDETLIADVPSYLAHNKESGCKETDDNPSKRLRSLALSRGLGSQSGSPTRREALASVPTASCRSSGNRSLSQNHSVDETPSSHESDSSVECQISERLARLTTNTAKFQTGSSGKVSDLGKVTEDDLRRLRHKLYSISGDTASFERREPNTEQACDNNNDPSLPQMDNLTVIVEGQNPGDRTGKSTASSGVNSYGPFKSAMDPVARFFKHLSPRRKENGPAPPASFFDPKNVEDIAFVSNYLYYTRPHTQKSKKSVGSTKNIEREDNLFRSLFSSDGQPCLQNFVGCSNFSSAVDKFLPRNAPQKSPTFAASLSGKEQEMSNWFEATFHQFSTAKPPKAKEVNGCIFQPPHLKAKGALLAKGTTSTSTLPSPLFFAQIPRGESPPQTPYTPMQQEEALNSLLPTPVSPDRALKKQEPQGFRFDHEQSTNEDYFASDEKLENKKENNGCQPSKT